MAEQVGLGSPVANFGQVQGGQGARQGAIGAVVAEAPKANAALARDERAAAAPFRGQEVAERGAMPDGPLGTSDSWGGSGFGQGALDSACDELIKLQKELEGLGSGPEAMTKSMSLQFKMQNIQQVISAVTKIREMAHESIMRTFSR